MATYTITTNAKREAGLTAAVAKENARRAAQAPPLNPITNDQYLQAVMVQAFDSYVDQDDQDQVLPVEAAFKVASPAQRAAAKAALGLS